MRSRVPASRRASWRTATPIMTCILTLTAWSAPPERAVADDQPAAASSTSTSSPIVFPHGKGSWRPASRAGVAIVKVGKNQQVTLRPAAASGRRNVSMTSRPSSTVVGRAGSTVTTSARLRTSQPGRRLTVRVLEVKGSRTVSSRSRTVKPSSRGWRSVSVRLTTTTPGARIRVQLQAKRLRGGRFARLTALRAVALPPAPASPASCQDIDYSDPAQGLRTFTEDFNGTALDPARWRVRDNTFLNQDKAWITKDAVTVHDGLLDIAGRRLPESQWKINRHALYPTNQVRDYSTGYVDTIDSAGYGNAAADRFGQKYGHFEVRAWVPSEATMSRGIWPAFWLRADHRAGEIDPMESYGAPTTRDFDPSSSYEWNSWADTADGASSAPNKQMTQGRANVGTDKIWQGWHTYGVNWSPTCLRYLYDGRTVGIVDFDDPATKSYFRGPSFDDTFHIRLNMQIGSNYWGWADPAHTRPEFSYRIDWVRVYQGKGLPTG